ncbi:MAG TPA: type II toxin-antitoxin system HipA family toxin [Kofleriaceae bacterium]|jgi:serine/threonine-protein kinase HipA
MERELEVVLARGTWNVVVGRLWARARGGNETASFEYSPEWLADRGRFELDPELPLGRGQFHTERALFNTFADCGPDRWGQTLLRRYERVRATAEGRAPRTLRAIDFVSLVSDETRLGALRFREPRATTFLTADSRVPPLVQLPRLLRATAAVIDDRDTGDDLALLLAPGTSLGGARPKATVLDAEGRLAIAKFPSRDDEWPITRWEAATLAMAAAARIDVSPRRLELVSKKPVLIVRRFDRAGARRIPYMSALTALAARDGDLRSYVELADTTRRLSASPRADLAQLWRRLVFNILVSNTDDHLRNHGFIHAEGGWRLAPAFDLNPMPTDVKPRIHAMALDETEQTASLELARSVTASFGIGKRDADAIVREVAKPAAAWRTYGHAQGITKRQLDRMASAFEHEDLAAARS